MKKIWTGMFWVVISGASSMAWADNCSNWFNCYQNSPSDIYSPPEHYQNYPTVNSFYSVKRSHAKHHGWSDPNSVYGYDSGYYRYQSPGYSSGYQYYGGVSSSNRYRAARQNDLTDSAGIWRDEYAMYDPRFMPKHIKSIGQRMFIFSPKTRQWGAYGIDGQLVAFGRANGGDNWCSELHSPCHTPGGTYQVYRKGDASCISHTFPLGVGGAKMPYCMFFHNGYSIHGSPYLSLHNGSHGCIRVTIDAARWLSENFVNYGTKVLILPY